MIKTILTTILSVCFLNMLLSQDTTVYNEYWDSGKLKLSGNLVNNERDGYWVEYNSNGSVSMKGSYKMGANKGVWEYYCPHGVREKIVWWGDGKCKRIQYHFLDEEPFIDISFEEGLELKDYLSFHNNYKMARRTQLELFKKTMGLAGSNFHYLKSKKLMYIFYYPSLEVDGQLHSVPDELLISLYKIDSLLIDNLKKISIGLNQGFTMNIYDLDVSLLENLHRDNEGDLHHDSLEYYYVSPYGKHTEWRKVNGVLFEKIKYHPEVEWYQTCTRYYTNGNMESKGIYNKGLRKGKWFYYDVLGNKYKMIKFKQDIPNKAELFKVDKTEFYFE